MSELRCSSSTARWFPSLVGSYLDGTGSASILKIMIVSTLYVLQWIRWTRVVRWDLPSNYNNVWSRTHRRGNTSVFEYQRSCLQYVQCWSGFALSTVLNRIPYWPRESYLARWSLHVIIETWCYAVCTSQLALTEDVSNLPKGRTRLPVCCTFLNIHCLQQKAPSESQTRW